LQIVRRERQKGIPTRLSTKKLLPVQIYALRPKAMRTMQPDFYLEGANIIGVHTAQCGFIP
jgi:hypothetical protein